MATMVAIKFNDEMKDLYNLFKENGNLKSEQPHLKGKREGVEKNYYPNQQLKTTVLYINSKKEGSEQGYSIKGNLYYERIYKNNSKGCHFQWKWN